MKKSNMILTGITTILLGTALITDAMLKDAYRKIDLDDPEKNSLTYPVQPFKALHITGGNSYLVQVVQAPRFALKVNRSRQSFLDTSRAGDTLKIGFTVGSHPGNGVEDLPVGLTIFCPDIRYIYFSGTQNLVRQLTGDSVSIRQDGHTWTTLAGSTILSLDLQGSQESWYELKDIRVTGQFHLGLRENAGINLRDMACRAFYPVVGDHVRVVFSGKSIHTCTLFTSPTPP